MGDNGPTIPIAIGIGIANGIGIGIVVDNARGPKARPRLRLSRNSNGAFECDRIYGEYREGVIYGCFCSLGAHP